MAKAKVEELIEAQLDQLITDDPLSFPNGESFIDALEKFMNGLIDTGTIDSWNVRPLASEGFKIGYIQKGVVKSVIRNPDGGRI